MVDHALCPRAGTAFEQLQFACELRMVKERDISLRKEWLDLQIGAALVEIARFGVALRTHPRLLVAQALGPKTFAYPAARIPVSDDGGQMVALDERGNFPYRTFEVDCATPCAAPALHHIVDHAALVASAFGVDDREREGVDATA